MNLRGIKDLAGSYPLTPYNQREGIKLDPLSNTITTSGKRQQPKKELKLVMLNTSSSGAQLTELSPSIKSQADSNFFL